MSSTVSPRLLLKLLATGPGFAAAEPVRFKLGKSMGAAAGLEFELEPLFANAAAGPGFGAAAGDAWFLASATAEAETELDPWALAHSLMREGLGLAGAASPSFAEPDLLQRWELSTPGAPDGLPLAAAEVCEFNDQKPPGAMEPGFAWHLGDSFSQLAAARTKVGAPAAVRIAHFDTGYDPAHNSFPAGVNKDLQWNFVDKDRPEDASDPERSGLLKNPGHGTGTLSILAGRTLQGMVRPDQDGVLLGGAANAEIVPVRVANSVVLFWTSAIARAFEYVLAPRGDATKRCDVVSMSMGGVASRAWAEAIDAAYEAGIVMVCAAGNNFSLKPLPPVPTRLLVYPARFDRVIAACGVMANGKPYHDLPRGTMQGNYGPKSRMGSAIAAYTPNVPWAQIGCAGIVDMDGAGTSAATPQVAAAAALWLAKHQPVYDHGWQRVEAVRKALFSSARKEAGDDFFEKLGNGLLRASDALAIAPAKAAELERTKRNSTRFAIFRVLTGLGLDADPRGAMLELEALQLLQRSQTLEGILADPDLPPEEQPRQDLDRFFAALIEEPEASKALKSFLGARIGAGRGQVPTGSGATQPDGQDQPVPPEPEPAAARGIEETPPPFRKLRIFAFDPSLGTRLETAILNHATVKVRWERDEANPSTLRPGPVGEYLEVVDYDPASACFYRPVDLDDPAILAQDGLAPSEGNPQFHQQMVYAVAMSTIQHFERALGRVALWSPRRRGKNAAGKYPKEAFVRRLRIYPHALREANAYYSPEKKALLFGYFPASIANAGSNLPGGTIFTCLSHDIVAHETAHALLDGLHRRFTEATNPDVFAFHEAFADLVAIFQHFTFPEALRHQLGKTRGDLGAQNLLGELAQQFGEGRAMSGPLRSALGQVDKATGQWRAKAPDPRAYAEIGEPHDRGAILVAAVFGAFVEIYKHRVADLLRIATGGSGVLPAGELHPDLVRRLATEASKAAGHLLRMCIRALDYCPPVDLSFGEYLRALVTADFDLVPDDDLGYRTAIIESFRRWGIYPRDVRTLSVESLLWRQPRFELGKVDRLLAALDVGWDLEADRRTAFEFSRLNRVKVHDWLVARDLPPEVEAELGITLSPTAPATIGRSKRGAGKGKPSLEVHSVRPLRRVGPDDQVLTDLVVELTQTRMEPGLSPPFRGGSTLIVDVKNQRVRFAVAKSILSQRRLEAQRKFLRSPHGVSLRATYFDSDGAEVFGALHRGL